MTGKIPVTFHRPTSDGLSDDEYYGPAPVRDGKAARSMRPLVKSKQTEDDADYYGTPSAKPGMPKPAQANEPRSGGRYPVRFNDFSPSAIAIHQREAAKVYAKLVGKEPRTRLGKIELPANICQYQADRDRRWFVCETVRRLTKAERRGYQLVALTLVLPAGLMEGEKLNAASVRRLTRHYQRLVAKIHGDHFSIGVIDVSLNKEQGDPSGGKFCIHVHLTLAIKAAAPEAALQAIEAALPNVSSPDERVYDSVKAEAIWNLEGWVGYCAQKLFLWGNMQRSAGLNKHGDRLVRKQTMPRRGQKHLVRAFLEVSPRQRIFLSGCRRNADRIGPLRPRVKAE